MPQLFANNAYSVLNGGINDTTTSIALSAGTGARFPSPTGGDYFLATLAGIDGNGVENAWEIVKCTARVTDVLTVVRAQEGTTGVSWLSGTRIELRVTAAQAAAFEAAVGWGNHASAGYLTSQISHADVLVDGDVGVVVQAYDVDTLKADVGDVLTAGFTSDSYARGTISSGTVTPAPATAEEAIQHYTNNGAHTLAPPTTPCTVIIEVTNGASAGAITTSGFTKVTGDAFTTTNGHDFHLYITRTATFSHLNVVALQ